MRDKLSDDPLWFKDAIFYEVYVRGFYDSNADGVGDFRGLTEKLDHIQLLGVDCILLLPIHASPLRDGGYDVSNYYAILPEYGTLDDFKHFLDAAHTRGIRVIADFTLNHTSDQHPWFQESRGSADAPKRDWYVWSETDQKYRDARIIHADTERSNWAWDDQAQAFYWHRFLRHEPDLNYENPEVRQAMFEVISFWLEVGIDGFRLNAAPYLFEKDGTSCENLPETHDYLRRLRAFVDEKYPTRLLMTEADQWPEDVAAYFGAGDELHMACHFPITPRLLMALRQEDRGPIVEILERTPHIPETCQWGMSLRSHDEMTLETRASEGREDLRAEYAKSLNSDARRRMAPLLDNGRRRIELMNGLFLSLPGSPFLYYGDEIGMGDNVYLGGRYGVRTPMQWSPDRNAGFSRADFAQLYYPVIADSVYGYQSVNVEAQMWVSTSLLHWIRGAIAVRKRHPVFGRGSLELIEPENRKILAFTRRYRDEIALCVYNLARSTQPAELDLSQYEGHIPVEMSGRIRFPRIERRPYQITFNEYGFFWFLLQKDDG
ncbi:MAG TPA: maltose alpha-D-glucosyltransferase [Blastocatellia bacterium]|nr:maltose alpha-D-glucosyltransferase [Blastocatellia bacterium]